MDDGIINKDNFSLNLTTETPGKSQDKFQKQTSIVEEHLKSLSPPGQHFEKSQKSVGRFQAQNLTSKDGHHFSSLFHSNPDSQPLNVRKQKSISEPLFSNKFFSDLSLHPHLVSCLQSRLEVQKMTKVQEQTIPLLLNGQDALVKSCTGSGKTLSYAVPIVQYLQEREPKVKRSDGVYVLVMLPTRELALQCFDTFSTLTKAFTWIVPGYLIGGEKKKSEKARLRKGINILISTPGRLLDHLDSTVCLSLDKIEWLVIDEADVLLEQKYEESISKIVTKCSPTRRGVLLSATLSKEVESLAGLSLTNPVCVDIANDPSATTTTKFQDLTVPANLTQFVMVVPSKLRLATLSGFITENCFRTGFKALIFMFSQSTVDFHHALLSEVLFSILKEEGHKCKFFKLHGNMSQEDRTEVFTAFRSAKEGVLLCTDVAARGLDLLHVDWIVQYSAPQSAEIYVHRVGRTARIGKTGKSLLFLLPSETNFSHLLADNKINFEEIQPKNYLTPLGLLSSQLKRKDYKECASVLHLKYEDLVYSEEELRKNAKEAFASYVQSYASYPKGIRNVLPFKALHLGHIAKSFCLREAPSQLGVKIPNHSQFARNRRGMKAHPFNKSYADAKPIKRRITAVVSEFDSGLSLLADDNKGKVKKRKH